MREALPLPLTVIVRGARTLLVSAARPNSPPVAEIMPYAVGVNPHTLGADIAARLNWQEQLHEAARMMLRAYAKAPTAPSTEMRHWLARMHEVCKLSEGR